MNKEEGDKTKRKESFYAKHSEIKSAFYTTKPIFVFLYKETLLNINHLDSSLPSVVFSSLLQEYEYVFPEDGPSGLPPPFMGIEHQIDFSPGVTIPNQLAHRTNPKETKELQCQVDELISPCTTCTQKG